MLTPYFNQNAILNTGSGRTPLSAVGDNAGFVYVYDDGPTIKKIDLANNYLTSYSVTPTTGNVGCITLLNSSSGIIGNTGADSVELWELATGYKHVFAATATACFTRAKNQQVAVMNGVSLMTSGTVGKISKFVNSTFTASALTPAWLASNSLTTVVAKPDTGTFLVGSATGLVAEIDASGTIIRNVALPTTPNNGTAPTHVVASIAYYSDILVVSTLNGIIHTYQWSTGTLLDRKFAYVNSTSAAGAWGTAGGGGGMVFCDAPSGVMICAPGANNPSNVFQPIFLGSISASGFSFEDTYVTGSTPKLAVACGVDHSVNKGWVVFRTSSSSCIQIFTIPDASLAGVDTRSQDPLGTDVAFRCIRLQVGGNGRSKVITDKNEPAGATTENCRKNADYVEIAIETGGTKADFRGFST